MNDIRIKLEFYDTYYWANAISNILASPFTYLRSLNSWGEDSEFSIFAAPFPKWSRFHSFARFVVHTSILDTLSEELTEEALRIGQIKPWLDRALEHHGIDNDGFASFVADQGLSLDQIDEDVLGEYYLEAQLSGPLDDLLDQIAEELFWLLFSNRVLMARFNSYAASWVSGLMVDDAPPELRKYLREDGVLKRSHIPRWARKAVFHRDKGTCTNCAKDLTHLISLASEDHFDHIIPLAGGGLNDVTNLQLHCDKCNLTKGTNRHPVSKSYQRWY